MTQKEPDTDDLLLDLPALDVELDDDSPSAFADHDELHLPGIESDSNSNDEPIDQEHDYDLVNEGPSLLDDNSIGLAAADGDSDIAFSENGEAVFIDTQLELGFGSNDEDDRPLLDAPDDALREIDDGGLEGLADPLGKQIDEHAFPALDGSEDEDIEDLDEALSIELPVLDETVAEDTGSAVDEDRV